MIIKCNRILLPPDIEDDDPVLREEKMQRMAKNIRKRKIAFDIAEVERISEHEDKRFTIVWFYYSGAEVIEYSYDKLEELYEEFNKQQEEGGLHYFLPAN